MATQEQWFNKLRSFVPAWFFELEDNNVAIFQGIAKLLEAIDGVADDHQAQTFILQSEQAFTDEHGFERNLTRLTNEIDLLFAERIRNISNTTACQTLQEVVDALLPVGSAVIVEDFNSDVFVSREQFLNRGEILIEDLYNGFSIVVDSQIHAPYSFASREFFLDREDFMGTNESSSELFELIIDAINRSKALGTAYRVIEKRQE